jgi:isopenicillin-N epimerase
VLPIETIVRELDRLGVDTLVDAAHAPGQVPVDVSALGAAYWTANGHKWLCGPKGTAMLHVREDRRGGVRPLVTSHGRNDPRTDRPPLWKAFDWMGTPDPTGFLVLPDAIRLVGSLDPQGWPGLMASNRTLALGARSRLQEALGSEPIAPESMIASLASVRIPSGPWSDAESLELNRSVHDVDGIEVPITGWPVRGARDAVTDDAEQVVVRLSAQRYNEPGDYEALADALARRGLGAAPARVATGPSAIVSG